MDRIKNITTAVAENFQILHYFSVDLFGCTKGQGMLGVHSPSPKYKTLTVFLLERLRIHPFGGNLYWIEDINTALSKII